MKAVSLIVFLFSLGAGGCATVSAISEAGPGSPNVYAGTRLDLRAIAGNDELKKSGAAPPRYPWLDLPFSVLLDTLMIPLTLPVASYEAVFE